MKMMGGAEGDKVDAWNDPQWAVAIFAARESAATLADVVCAVLAACAGHSARIDVLVNGNPDLARELAQQFTQQPFNVGAEALVCIWFFELGDKAQTWNAYVHHLYRGAERTFFIDGYAKPASNALNELALALDKDDHALAATGVPSCGRSAASLLKTMRHSGGIHGNLFTLTRRTMDEIRQRRFRLPMGLYRTDSLIGAVINFGFNPASNDWDPSRIRVQPTATWQFKPLQWWRPGDLNTHLKRKRRQAQGDLENLAVRDHLACRRQAPEILPKTVSELVLQWWHGENKPKWYQILRHPEWLLASQRFRKVRDWSDADLPPIMVYRNRGAQNDGNTELTSGFVPRIKA